MGQDVVLEECYIIKIFFLKLNKQLSNNHQMAEYIFWNNGLKHLSSK